MFVPFFFIFLFFLSFTIPIIQQKKNLFFVRKLMLEKKKFSISLLQQHNTAIFYAAICWWNFWYTDDSLWYCTNLLISKFWFKKKKNLTIKIFCIKNLKVTVYKLKKLAYFIDISMLYSYLTLNTFKLIWVVFLFFEIWL